MSIQPISFGATTKNGNHYKKTHAGTILGAVAGVTSIACDLKNAQKIKLPTNILKILVNNMQKMTSQNIDRQIAKNIALNSFKTGAIGGIITAGLILFGIGAGINKIANAIKAKKADNAAKQA